MTTKMVRAIDKRFFVQPAEAARRGMILFVVVAMLGLFAVVSVAFYYYAGQEHLISRVALENEQRTRPDPDALLAYALRMLVFDEAGYGPFRSAIATHSLLRNMFGSEGSEAFSGTGRFHGEDYSYPFPKAGDWYDHYYATCYVGRSYKPAQDGSCNPPYTYADMNHVFLGHLTRDPQTGQFVVTAQSFIRRNLPGVRNQGVFDPYDPGNLGFWTNDPNWSNFPPQLRQALVFRPHPLLHPNFPPPADIGGDVRNLPPGIPVKLPNGQLHYGSDSIWIDLGFPVQVGPDGRTYKPLFAFFITDLDGRCNLNVAHWDKSQVLLDPLGAGAFRPAEAEYLLRHGDTNADSFTSSLFQLLPNTMRDIHRRQMLTVTSSDLRWGGFVPQLYRNPWSDSSTQQDASNVITYPNNNPDEGPRWAGYGLQYGTTPGPGNNPRVLWTWQGSTPEPPGQSRQLLQGTFANQGDFLLRNQGGVWEWTGRISTVVNRYDPNVNVIGTAPLLPSRVPLDLKARIQTLSPYPAVVDLQNDGPDSQEAKRQLRDAIARRQQLAREIYFRLLYVCGLLDENPQALAGPASTPNWVENLYPNKVKSGESPWPPTGVRARVVNPFNPTDQELQPLRYLAQLAVNIVDYLDPDDYSTPFMFYTDMEGYPLDDPARPSNAPNPNLRYWVFGTERPKVVINETLFEYQEPVDNNNQRMDGPFDMRCWVELFSPSGAGVILGPDDPSDPMNNPPRVTVPRYKLQIAAARYWPNVDPIAGANLGDNVVGEIKPEDLRTQTTGDDLLHPPPAGNTTPRPPWQLPFNNYLLIGPLGDTVDQTFSDLNNVPPNRIQTDNLRFRLERKGNAWEFTDPQGKKHNETKEYLVLLRKLAYPQMNDLTVPQTLGEIPDYEPRQNPLVVNPYLTVDMTLIKQGQGLCDRTQGGKSISWARTNPYADAQNNNYDQQDPNPVQVNNNATNTWHSLGKQNAGLVTAPPKHPDGLVDPTTGQNLSLMDVLQVSAFKPHLLTRRYRNGQYPEYHYAPWFDDSARISRVLEFLELPRTALPSPGSDRVFGRVNLNTADPREIFAAITEWPSPSGQNIANKWATWLTQRQSRGPSYGFAAGNIAACPPLPGGLSNGQDSWFRTGILLDDNAAAPLQEHVTFLGSIYDRITTRSNVFAVWCTVGFFEANAAGQLGKEIDADIGRAVRYRFFAIVDRTILAEWMLQNNKPVETQLGRTDIDPRFPGPNGEPPCVIYWSRIQ